MEYPPFRHEKGDATPPMAFSPVDTDHWDVAGRK
jgi:hypothetical protein